MRTIRIHDPGDYAPDWPLYKRDSARAIISVDGKLALVRSEKYGDYGFPGGGIDPGETHTDALVREVLEETGLRVLPDSIRPYGRYLIRRRGIHAEYLIRRNGVLVGEIFEQDNFYYCCEIDPDFRTERNLDDNYEKEYDYRLVFATPEEAIAANEKLLNIDAIPWVERELYVLRELAGEIPCGSMDKIPRNPAGENPPNSTEETPLEGAP